MTEQEFSKQVWRMYDQVTTADGVKGKVMGVAFSTKSVRAYIAGSPEWLKCEVIETHTTGKGGDDDDNAIIEELHNKALKQADEIERLRNEKNLLAEKISRNYLGDLLRAVNLIQQGLRDKKHKIEQIDSGLKQIQDALEKMNNNNF